MNLSKNFSLQSFIKSATALTYNIDNTPEERHIERAKLLAENILQPARDHFGEPISVTSGYRSPALCVKIGSTPTSDHTTGGAADIEFYRHDRPLIDLGIWIVESVPFSKIIFEYMPNGWFHVYYDEDDLRGKILVKDKDYNYIRKTLTEIKELYEVA